MNWPPFKSLWPLIYPIGVCTALCPVVLRVASRIPLAWLSAVTCTCLRAGQWPGTVAVLLVSSAMGRPPHPAPSSSPPHQAPECPRCHRPPGWAAALGRKRVCVCPSRPPHRCRALCGHWARAASRASASEMGPQAPWRLRGFHCPGLTRRSGNPAQTQAEHVGGLEMGVAVTRWLRGLWALPWRCAPHAIGASRDFHACPRSLWSLTVRICQPRGAIPEPGVLTVAPACALALPAWPGPGFTRVVTFLGNNVFIKTSSSCSCNSSEEDVTMSRLSAGGSCAARLVCRTLSSRGTTSPAARPPARCPLLCGRARCRPSPCAQTVLSRDQAPICCKDGIQ